MVYNNKKVGAKCGCHITFCVQTQYLWFSKFIIIRNVWIYLNGFYVFLKCGILRNLFSIHQRKVCFLLCRLFIKKNYYNRYYDIYQMVAKKKRMRNTAYLFVCFLFLKKSCRRRANWSAHSIFLRSEYRSSYWYHSNTPNSRPLFSCVEWHWAHF